MARCHEIGLESKGNGHEDGQGREGIISLGRHLALLDLGVDGQLGLGIEREEDGLHLADDKSEDDLDIEQVVVAVDGLFRLLEQVDGLEVGLDERAADGLLAVQVGQNVVLEERLGLRRIQDALHEAVDP